MDSILSHVNPVHTLTSCFFETHINIMLPSTSSLTKWSLSYGFPDYMYNFVYSSCLFMRATCSAHLTNLNLIILILLCEEYKL